MFQQSLKLRLSLPQSEYTDINPYKAHSSFRAGSRTSTKMSETQEIQAVNTSVKKVDSLGS